VAKPASRKVQDQVRELTRRVLADAGLPDSVPRESFVQLSELNPVPSANRDHPVLAITRLQLAVSEALTDLAAAGVIAPAHRPDTYGQRIRPDRPDKRGSGYRGSASLDGPSGLTH